MRIERVAAELVRLPLERAVQRQLDYLTFDTGGGLSRGAGRALDYVLVRLTATGGVEGLGYACLYAAAPGGGAHGAALRALVDDLAPLVRGEDTRYRGRVWRALERAGGAVGHGDLARAAVSAYDLALWDIAGKAAGLPVWHLLGGVRDRLPVYYSGLFLGASLDELRAEARAAPGLGYRAIKLRVGRADPDEDVARVRAVREVVGEGIRLLADCSRSLDAGRAIRLGRRLERLGVAWLEEPVPPEDLAGAARVASVLDVTVAGGESARTVEDVRALLEHRAADLVMLDIQRLGGLTGWLQAAALCGAHRVAVSNHLFLETTVHALAACPWAIGTAAGVAAADDIPAEHLPWPTPFEAASQVAHGELRLSDAAGLGLTPRDDVIRRHRVG